MRNFLSFIFCVSFFAACADYKATPIERQRASDAAPGTTQSAKDPAGPEKENSSPLPEKDGETGNKPADAETPDSPQTVPTGPSTKELSVRPGQLTFDLSSSKESLSGASLSASVTINPAAGQIPASITLSNIVLKTGSSIGLSLYQPVLILVSGDKEKSFPIGTNIKLKVPKARSVPLADLINQSFEGVEAGAKVKLRFSALEPMAENVLEGIPNYRECKAPQKFEALTKALQPCKACHDGLFTYDFMEKDVATACGQNLKIIDRTLSANGSTPKIPSGTHHGAPAGAVKTGFAALKASEGL